MEGFKKALDYYSSLGISYIMLPKGYYPMCYRNPSGINVWSSNINWEIILPSNITFDLGGSTIKVIYDSENRNPYDKCTTLKPCQLNGRVFAFNKTEHSTLKNGTIIGDRFDRAYSTATTTIGTASDQWQEQTYAIFITGSSQFCTIEDLNISGFMGDAISGDANHNSNKGTSIYSYSNAFYPGSIDTSGKLVASTSIYSTNLISLGNIKDTLVLRTNIGYTYVPDFVNQEFLISFYDANSTFIIQRKLEHLQNCNIPYNATQIRLTIYDEIANQAQLNKTWQISPPSSEFIDITNCEIFACNRGGLSNLPHDVIIDNCYIHNNGTGKEYGWLQFPDTTRYAINCEDTVTRAITIKNCSISNHFNTLLISGKNIIIEDSTFLNCDTSVLNLYNSKFTTFQNNVLINCGGIAGFMFSNYSWVRTLICTNLQLSNTPPTVGKQSNTIVTTKNIIALNSKPSVSDISDLILKTYTTPKSEINSMSGVLNNINVQILYPQLSTFYSVINMDKQSKDCVFDFNNTRIQLLNAYNSKIIKATIKQNLNSIQNTQNCIMEYSTNYIEFYSNGTFETTSNYKNCIFNDINLGSTFFSIQKNSTPNSTTIANFIYNFEDCEFNITKEAVLYLVTCFSTPYSDIQKIIINLKNCKFTSTCTNKFKITNITGTHITVNVDNQTQFIGNISLN